MQSILQELYEEGLHPSEQPVKYLRKRAQLRAHHSKLYDALTDALTADQQAQLDAFVDAYVDDMSIGNCEAFIQGFQLGSRIMLEALALPEIK